MQCHCRQRDLSNQFLANHPCRNDTAPQNWGRDRDKSATRRQRDAPEAVESPKLNKRRPATEDTDSH